MAQKQTGLGFLVELIGAVASIAPTAATLYLAKEQTKKEKKEVKQAILSKQAQDQQIAEARAAAEAEARKQADSNPQLPMQFTPPSWVKPALIGGVALMGLTFVIYKWRTSKSKKSTKDEEPETLMQPTVLEKTNPRRRHRRK